MSSRPSFHCLPPLELNTGKCPWPGILHPRKPKHPWWPRSHILPLPRCPPQLPTRNGTALPMLPPGPLQVPGLPPGGLPSPPVPKSPPSTEPLAWGRPASSGALARISSFTKVSQVTE